MENEIVQVQPEDILPKGKKLTLRQQRFVQAYARTGNATKSAKEAGYSEATAYSIGHDLLKNPEISGAISMELKYQATAEALSTQKIIDSLEDIANDPTTGKMARIRAFELLGKTKAMFVDRQDTELSGRVSLQFGIPRPDEEWKPED